MKRLVLGILLITTFCASFLNTYAAPTQQDLQNLLSFRSTFENIDNNFGNRYVGMVNSVYTRFKDDPDVDATQFRRYVLEGIPGATIPDQKGFIPLLKGVIDGGASSDYTSKAELALAQANYLLQNAKIDEQLAGGSITKDQATDQKKTTNAELTKKTDQILSKRATQSCSFLNDSPLVDCITVGITWIVKSLLLNIVGFALWLSANLLNYAMYIGIFQFKVFAPDQIYAIWLVVRQTVSLFVFFAGLFVGFMAIIGKSDDFKKYMAFLIIYGLFVNFSYPIVRVFVDVSNVVSLQLYQAALGPEVLKQDTSGDSTAGAKIVSKMGLQGLVMSATAGSESKNGFQDKINSLPGALAAVGFVGYAAYIFFMAAALIIIRTALLVCIICASPLLLVDAFVPALGDAAKWLRGAFVSQLFVAPVFTIMLALTLKFLDVFSTTANNPMTGASSGGTLQSAASGGANTYIVFFNLIMMLIMLHIMLKVTKATAGSIGQTVTGWAGKIGGVGTGLATNAAFAGLGFAGRNTIGRGAKLLSDRIDGGGFMGEAIKKGLGKVGGANYDLRNLGAVQSGAGALGLRGMGQGQKKGYDQLRKEKDKADAEYASTLSPEAQEKFLRRTKGEFGILRGGESPELRNAWRANDDVLKNYVNADEEGRKRMQDDNKNSRFTNQFGNIDAYKNATTQQDKDAILKTLSASVQKTLQEKDARDGAKKIRTEESLASFLTANTNQQQKIRVSAENDPKLLEKLAIIEELSKLDSKATDAVDKKIEQLKKLGPGNEDLIKKLIANDPHQGLTEAEALLQKERMYTQLGMTVPAQAEIQRQYQEAQAALNGETLQQKTNRETKEASQQAQIQAMQAQAQASQQAAQMASQAIQQAQAQAAQTTQFATQALQQAQAQAQATSQTLNDLTRATTDLHQTLKQIVTPT